LNRPRSSETGPARFPTLRSARRTRLVAWIVATYQRIGYHKTLVAIADKQRRM